MSRQADSSTPESNELVSPVDASPFSPKQVKVSLLRNQVGSLIRDAIIEMRLQPGQVLVERELMEWTGVSRATVREALRQLAAEGLIKTIPQKGTVVAVPSLLEANDIYEIRALLEGLAARQFTERADSADLAALEEALDAIEAAARTDGDPRPSLRAKQRFYDVLFAGAANETLKDITVTLQARVTMLRATSISRRGRAMEAAQEIRAIVEAVLRRDAAAAESACVRHVRAAAASALEALSTGDSAE